MTYVLDCNIKATFLNKCKKGINLVLEILLDIKKVYTTDFRCCKAGVPA